MTDPVKTWIVGLFLGWFWAMLMQAASAALFPLQPPECCTCQDQLAAPRNVSTPDAGRPAELEHPVPAL